MNDHELFDLYTDYLLCSMGQATSTKMSSMLQETVSHDRISRLLGKQEWTAKNFWLFIKPLVRETESASGIIKIDDTIEHKPHSSENALICWHYDHSLGRSVKGINILNFLYEPNPNEFADFSYPISFELTRKTEQYVDSKTGKIKRRSDKKKNDVFRDRLRIIHFLNKVQYQTLLWDSWFSSNENMTMVHKELKKTFIGAIKDNRLIALSLKDKQAGKFTKINRLDWHTTKQRVVYLKGLAFPVQIVQEVFTNKDDSVGELFLVTNDLELSYHYITSTYNKRWDIEVYHRSLKQNVCLEKSPTKKEITQANHIFASMVAWVKLEFLSKKQQQNHYAFKAQLYVGAIQTAFCQLQKIKNAATKLLPQPEQQLLLGTEDN